MQETQKSTKNSIKGKAGQPTAAGPSQRTAKELEQKPLSQPAATGLLAAANQNKNGDDAKDSVPANFRSHEFTYKGRIVIPEIEELLPPVSDRLYIFC